MLLAAAVAWKAACHDAFEAARLRAAEIDRAFAAVKTDDYAPPDDPRQAWFSIHVAITGKDARELFLNLVDAPEPGPDRPWGPNVEPGAKPRKHQLGLGRTGAGLYGWITADGFPAATLARLVETLKAPVDRCVEARRAAR